MAMGMKVRVVLIVGVLVVCGATYLGYASDSSVTLPTGQKIDSELITVGGVPVLRQRYIIADPSNVAGFARILNETPAPGDYGLVVRPNTHGANSAISSVNDSTTSQLLKTVNAQRISLTIVNTSSAVLFVVKSSGAASGTNFTYRLEQYATVTIDDYVGVVNGVWETDPGDGLAMVTEVTT